MRKNILLSILKTWLLSTFLSLLFLYLYLDFVRRPMDEYRHMCDMSVLAYGLIIMWILFLSLISFSALLSLNKKFQKPIVRFLCWFLFPILFCVTFFLALSEGNLDKETVLISFISCLPWFSIWGFYYHQFNKKISKT